MKPNDSSHHKRIAMNANAFGLIFLGLDNGDDASNNRDVGEQPSS